MVFKFQKIKKRKTKGDETMKIFTGVFFKWFQFGWGFASNVVLVSFTCFAFYASWFLTQNLIIRILLCLLLAAFEIGYVFEQSLSTYFRSEYKESGKKEDRADYWRFSSTANFLLIFPLIAFVGVGLQVINKDVQQKRVIMAQIELENKTKAKLLAEEEQKEENQKQGIQNKIKNFKGLIDSNVELINANASTIRDYTKQKDDPAIDPSRKDFLIKEIARLGRVNSSIGRQNIGYQNQIDGLNSSSTSVTSTPSVTPSVDTTPAVSSIPIIQDDNVFFMIATALSLESKKTLFSLGGLILIFWLGRLFLKHTIRPASAIEYYLSAREEARKVAEKYRKKDLNFETVVVEEPQNVSPPIVPINSSFNKEGGGQQLQLKQVKKIEDVRVKVYGNVDLVIVSLASRIKYLLEYREESTWVINNYFTILCEQGKIRVFVRLDEFFVLQPGITDVVFSLERALGLNVLRINEDENRYLLSLFEAINGFIQGTVDYSSLIEYTHTSKTMFADPIELELLMIEFVKKEIIHSSSLVVPMESLVKEDVVMGVKGRTYTVKK